MRFDAVCHIVTIAQRLLHLPNGAGAHVRDMVSDHLQSGKKGSSLLEAIWERSTERIFKISPMIGMADDINELIKSSCVNLPSKLRRLRLDFHSKFLY